MSSPKPTPPPTLHYQGSTSHPIYYSCAQLPTPRRFYSDHVYARRPAVFRSGLSALGLGGLERLKDCADVLRRVAGDEDVEVSTTYGRSFRPSEAAGVETMRFGDFLDRIGGASNDDDDDDDGLRYYLATQTIGVDQDTGRPHLHSVPTSQFLESLDPPLPRTPAILGDLIPVNYNIWLGGGGAGRTNSGLHHDYHDNFYVLCAGEKEVRGGHATRWGGTNGGSRAALSNASPRSNPCPSLSLSPSLNKWVPLGS